MTGILTQFRLFPHLLRRNFKISLNFLARVNYIDSLYLHHLLLNRGPCAIRSWKNMISSSVSSSHNGLSSVSNWLIICDTHYSLKFRLAWRISACLDKLLLNFPLFQICVELFPSGLSRNTRRNTRSRFMQTTSNQIEKLAGNGDEFCHIFRSCREALYAWLTGQSWLRPRDLLYANTVSGTGFDFWQWCKVDIDRGTWVYYVCMHELSPLWSVRHYDE